jgi:hypothetical protein
LSCGSSEDVQFQGLECSMLGGSWPGSHEYSALISGFRGPKIASHTESSPLPFSKDKGEGWGGGVGGSLQWNRE